MLQNCCYGFAAPANPTFVFCIINMFCQQTYLTAISPFSWEHKLIYEGEMSIVDCDH